MRSVNLTSAKGGINRLRFKGSPRPDNLYDALNCFVTSSNTVQPRPGTFIETALPAGTIGLTAYQSGFVVFASDDVTMTDTRFSLVILKHPTEPSRELSFIHFAEPYLQYLYVAAEFNDASVFHYWLQPVAEWEADTDYKLGDIVSPTTANGYAFRATRFGSPNPLWTANTPFYFGDVVEPTVANGFYFTVTDAIGDNPKSGATEPVWNAMADAVTIEDFNIANADVTSGAGSTTVPTTTVPDDVSDRYDNGLPRTNQP